MSEVTYTINSALVQADSVGPVNKIFRSKADQDLLNKFIGNHLYSRDIS